MNELKAKNYHGKKVLDSRDVAGMVEKQHKDLLRDIRGYIAVMEKNDERNFTPVDFFIPSTYTDRKRETRPCYFITKKGCDMVANKLTGEKGILFTAAYVTAFEEMQKTLAAPPIVQLPEGVSLSGLAKLLNATRRMMLDMGNSPAEIGAVAYGLCASCGVVLHEAFTNQIPGQLCLFGPGGVPQIAAS